MPASTGTPVIDCAPDGGCAAVIGSSTLTYDGTSWQTTTTGPSYQVPVGGLGCAAAGTCFAAPPKAREGSVPRVPTFQRWDGTGWSAEPGGASPPRSTGATRLQDVSCVTDAWCLAVGQTQDDGATRITAQRWDRRSWTLIEDLTTSVAGLSEVQVSCAAIDRCVAGALRTSSGTTGRHAVHRPVGRRPLDRGDGDRTAAPARHPRRVVHHGRLRVRRARRP